MQVYTTISKKYESSGEISNWRKMYMMIGLSTNKSQPIRDWKTQYSSTVVTTTDDVYINVNDVLYRFDKRYLLNYSRMLPAQHHATQYDNTIYNFVPCGRLIASRGAYFDGICWSDYGQTLVNESLYVFGGDDCYNITQNGRKRYLETMNPTHHEIIDFAPMDDFTPLYASMHNNILSVVASNDILFECNQITWDLRCSVVSATDFIGPHMLDMMMTEYTVRWSHADQLFMANERGSVILYDRAAAKWTNGKPITLIGNEYLESVSAL